MMYVLRKISDIYIDYEKEKPFNLVCWFAFFEQSLFFLIAIVRNINAFGLAVGAWLVFKSQQWWGIFYKADRPLTSDEEVIARRERKKSKIKILHYREVIARNRFMLFVIVTFSR